MVRQACPEQAVHPSRTSGRTASRRAHHGFLRNEERTIPRLPQSIILSSSKDRWEGKMIFLFNQHWDIIPGKEEEYTKFVINHYIPTMKKIGINPVGGFYVVVGEGPGVISVGTVDSLQKLQKAMETEEYEKVTAQVQCYVVNYCSQNS